MMWSRKISTFNPDGTRLPAACCEVSGTGSDVEGEATATYLHHLLKEMVAGYPALPRAAAGSGLSHADTLTLMKALEGRIRL